MAGDQPRRSLLKEAPALSVALGIVLSALALVFLLFLPDPALTRRVLSIAAALAALLASVVSFRVLALKGVTLDPLAGTALLLASLGFPLASAGWFLNALSVDIAIGPVSLAKLLWYSSGLMILLALHELGRFARLLAGLKLWEVGLAVAVTAAYLGAVFFLLFQVEAPLMRVVEALVLAVFVALSMLASLPICRGRLSFGLALVTVGITFFVLAVCLQLFLRDVPVVIVLYALSFISAAAGISLYGEESPLAR